MSKRVSLSVTDDLDDSENAHTVSFGLDDVSYEIDLSEENQARLEQILAPFISAGRRVRQTRRQQTRRQQTRQQGTSSADRAAMRAWAKSAGLKVSERGRVSRVVLREYQISQQGYRVTGSFGLGGDEPGD